MGSPIQFKGGVVCALSVRDLQKSIQWYQQTLGFSVSFRLDEYGWAEVKTPWKDLYLGLSQVEKVEPQGGVTPTFGVADIEAARKSLEKQSVRFDGPTHTIEGQVKLATFFDPDGNRMMLAQSLT